MSKFIELENFIIKSDDDIGYFDDVVKQVQSTEVEIMEFFGLKELNPKVTIEIMRYEPFKNHIINKYGEIASYVRGDGSAKDRYIRILDIEDQIKYTSHKNATLENTLLMISHEMVHARDSVNVSNNFYKSIWFREGLATNLSHQDYECIDLSNCDFNKLVNDFRHYPKYTYAYTIVNYILNNYSHEEVMKMDTDLDYLMSICDEIFEKAKEANMGRQLS